MSGTVVRCEDEAATLDLGRRLGAVAAAGTVITLDGPLGAGKTVVSKGVGQGIGVPGRLTSPTFVIVALHEGGRLPVWHCDLYRLGDASELELLGLDDAAEGVLLVEWARRALDELPQDRLEITLHIDGDARDVHLHATGPAHAALLGALS